VPETGARIFLLGELFPSPQGLRWLRDQIQAAPKMSGFAQHQVFTLKDFAKQCLSFFESLEQKSLFPVTELDPIDALLRIAQSQDLQSKPAQAALLFSGLERLKLFSMSFDDWTLLTHKLEEHRSSPELSLWTKKILAFLDVSRFASSKNLFFGPWEALGRATQYLSEHHSLLLTESQSSQLFKRLNGDQRLSLVLPPRESLYPIEQQFVSALRRLLPGSIEFESLNDCPLISQANPAPMVWTKTLSAPKGLELYYDLPEDLDVDLFEDGQLGQDTLKSWRQMYQQLDYQSQSKPDYHRLSLKPTAEISLSDERLNDFGDSQKKLWLEVIAPHALSSMRQTPDAKLKNQSFNGTTILELRDLFWVKAFSDSVRCDPISHEALEAFDVERSELPPELIHLLEALHNAVPTLAQFKKSILDCFENLKKLEISTKPARSRQTQPPLSEQKIESVPNRISPTGLQQLLNCPFQYYAHRIVRIEDLPTIDDVDIKRNVLGQWLHKALELLLQKAPPPTIGASAIQTLLCEHLINEIPNFFTDNASPAYKRRLSAEANLYAERLSWYWMATETTLAQWAAGRFKTRTEIDAQKLLFDSGVKLWGRIDRVDINEQSKTALIWDYKTGLGPTTKPETQVKNNELQWFLYKDMFEAQNPDYLVVGGGYLRVLQPLESCFFWYDNARIAMPEFTVGSTHLIDQKSAQSIRLALDEKLVVGTNVLKAKVFTPHPIKESLCTRCHAQSLCGRPELTS
jgi:hypothetical protein